MVHPHGGMLFSLEKGSLHIFSHVGLCECMLNPHEGNCRDDTLFSLTVVIFSQCLHISKHQVIHLKYIQFFMANSSKKLFLKRLHFNSMKIIMEWK